MDQALQKTIEVVALDAIKILGPAGIAGYVAYRTATAQLKAKLLELKQSQAFAAREHIFKQTQSRLARVESDLEKLNEQIGQLIGMLAANGSTENDIIDVQMVRLLGALAHALAPAATLEVRSTLRDMERTNNEKSEIYAALSQFATFSIDTPATDQTVLQEQLLQLRQLHTILAAGLRTVLNSELRMSFQPVIQPALESK